MYFLFFVRKHYCLPLSPINVLEFDDPEYDDFEKPIDDPMYLIDFFTTATTEKPSVYQRKLEKLREEYMRCPDLATGVLYPKGFYVGFPGIEIYLITYVI